MFTFHEVTESRHYEPREAFEVTLFGTSPEEIATPQHVAWLCFSVQLALE